MPTRYVTIRMKHSDAQALVLLACACGHSPWNHFGANREKSCARCKCPEYRERARVGKLVATSTPRAPR